MPGHPQVRPVRIVSTGMALPARCVTSLELDERLRLAPGTIEARCGVRRRYFAERETSAQLAATACESALARSGGLHWDDVDCLIAANATMDQALPYNAALVHAELGLHARRTSTFDVGASCLSFLAAVDFAGYMLQAGRYRNVMVVSTDLASVGLDWNDLETCGMFGDGAAAALLTRAQSDMGTETDEGSAILAARFETLSDGVDFCKIPAGGSRYHPGKVEGRDFMELNLFKMRGKPLFRLMAAEIPAFIHKLLDNAGMRHQGGLSSLARIIPHQASRLGLSHMMKRLQIPAHQFTDIIADYGNQVAASLPTALHLTLTSQSPPRRGDTMMLIGTSAGVSMGGMIVRY